MAISEGVDVRRKAFPMLDNIEPTLQWSFPRTCRSENKYAAAEKKTQAEAQFNMH